MLLARQPEQGKRNVTIGTADELASALGLSLSSLFAKLEQDPGGPEGE